MPAARPYRSAITCRPTPGWRFSPAPSRRPFRDPSCDRSRLHGDRRARVIPLLLAEALSGIDQDLAVGRLRDAQVKQGSLGRAGLGFAVVGEVTVVLRADQLAA